MNTSRLNIVGWACCSLLLAACHPVSSPTITPTPQKQIVPEEWFKLSGVARTTDLIESLSPNSLWLSDFIQIETDHFFRVFSTTDSTRVLESQLDEKTGAYLSLHAWAPDSSAVAVYGADKGEAGCPFNRLIIYDIPNDGRQLTSAIFKPPTTQDVGCLKSVWSPDGSKLAVNFTYWKVPEYQEVFIINKQAQILQTIPLTLKSADSLLDLRWTNFGLFYVVMNTENMEQSYYDLNKIDLQNPGGSTNLLHSHYWTFRMIGASPTSQRLLLEALEFDSRQGESFNLLIINSETQAIERTLEVQGSYCKSADSMTLPFTALHIARPGEPCGGDTDLWIYNWDTSELRKRGEIDTLVGWQANDQGFEIVREASPDRFEFEIIKP